MFRLGLRLALSGGREALTRLVVTICAVMIGSALLLSVLALFHGYKTAESKPCLSCQRAPSGDGDRSVLWSYRKDVYKGKNITRVDLAKLSNYSITIPGVPEMPRVGHYYASPAMEALLKDSPARELDDRYPGKQAGTIGKAGLKSPDELVIIIGRSATDLSSTSEAQRISDLSIPPEEDDSGAIFLQFLAALGAFGLLFPMLILVVSATRLGAVRREERYAAFRLVGATPKQVSIIASTDAAIASIVGVVAGAGIFFALQPFLADFALTGSRSFASDVRPPLWEFVLILIGVPVSAIIASFLSLRRLNVSPLGVSRKTTPPSPRIKSLLPLVLGIAVFAAGLLLSSTEDPPFLAVPGLMFIMIGLITGGPWLTLQAARLMGKVIPGAVGLLATRRLTDNPRVAFRAVSGLVLVVLAASVTALMAPAVLTQRLPAQNSVLDTVLTAEFFPSGTGKQTTAPAPEDGPHLPMFGLQPAEGRELTRQLQDIPGVTVFPIYAEASDQSEIQGRFSSGDRLEPVSVIGCASLERLSVLGTCPSAAESVVVDRAAFEAVIHSHQISSLATEKSQALPIDTDTMLLRAIFVQASDATALEEARTLLSQRTVVPTDGALLTFEESRQAALATAAKLQAIISAGVIITLITAGSSIAVAVAGGLIERKRPFGLLRLSGAPLSVLYKVVLWEAAVPLMSATLVAGAIGIGAGMLTIAALAPDGVGIEMPELPYILALVSGPVIALLIVGATLPLVGRLTKPDDARFE